MSHQNHSHGHHHHDSCGSCGEECGCCSHHEGSCHEKGEFVHTLLELADEAWMEVLKDKIKEHIIASSGGKLDELAKIVSDSNGNRWKNKMASEKGISDFKNDVSRFFGGDECKR